MIGDGSGIQRTPWRVLVLVWTMVGFYLGGMERILKRLTPAESPGHDRILIALIVIPLCIGRRVFARLRPDITDATKGDILIG